MIFIFRSLIAAISALALLLTAAHANTTVFTDSSNFRGFADPVDVQNSDGGADGVSAFIPNGGWIAFANPVGGFFNEVSSQIVLTNITGPGTARFYVGRTNSTGFFSVLNFEIITLTNGLNEVTSTGLTNFCVGLGGCDTVIFQPIAGTTLSVDRVLARNPEPGVWSLMILGFGGLAWRMKLARGARTSSAACTALG